MLADPLLLVDPLLSAAPVLPADPVLPDPVLAAPVLAAGGVLSGGLVPASLEEGGLDVGAAGVEELPLAGVVTVAWGSAVFDVWAELVAQGVPVPLAVCSVPVALVLAFAEAVVLASPVAEAVALGDSGAVALAVPVAVVAALALSAELLLALPVAGLLTELAGGALGDTVAVLADWAWVDDDEADWQVVAGTPLWSADVSPWLTPLADEPA